MRKIHIDPTITDVELATVYAPFDVALKVLRDGGYDLLSAAQNADLRIKKGIDSIISQNGNWVREGVIYFPADPAERYKLVRNSPILESPREAMKSNRQKEFVPSVDQIDKAIEDSIDFPYAGHSIQINYAGSDELLAYLLGGEERARHYAELLKEAGITRIDITREDHDYRLSQKQPFVRQVWFGAAGRKISGSAEQISRIRCNELLTSHDILRGIKQKTQGGAQ